MFALVSGAAEMMGVFCFWLCRYLPRGMTRYIASSIAITCSLVLLIGDSLSSGVLVAIAGAALKFGGGIANGGYSHVGGCR